MKSGVKTKQIQIKPGNVSLAKTANEQPVEIGVDSLNNSVFENKSRGDVIVEKSFIKPSSSCELIRKAIGFSIKVHADSIVELIADDLIAEVIPVLNLKERNQQIAEEKQRRKLLTLLLETRIEEFQQTKIEVAKLTSDIIDLDDLKSNSEVYLKRKAENVQSLKIGLSLPEMLLSAGQSFKATRSNYVAKKPRLQKQVVDQTKEIANEMIMQALDAVIKNIDNSLMTIARSSG